MKGVLGTLAIATEWDNKGLKEGAAEADRISGRFSTSVGPKLAKGLAIGTAAVGALSAAALGATVATVKMAAKFEASMSQSLAIMGDVSDQMRKEMADAAREVAKTTTYSADQAAKAYFYLASAGLDAQQSIAAMPKVAAFAQAGMFDLALATDLLTDAQSALGLTSKSATENMENMARVSDVLVKANTLANASVQQFSEALTTQAGAAMKTVNMEIEEGVAVLAAFADQGIKGSYAGTVFSIVLRDLQTKALENEEVFKEFGVTVFDTAGNIRNMGDIVSDLERALDGMSDAQIKSTLLQMGFADKSVGAMLALLGTSDAIKNYESNLRSAGGITDQIAEKQLDNLNAQLGLLRDKLVDVGIGLGTKILPYVREFVDELNKAIDEAMETGDWSKVGERIGQLIGDGIKTATPYIVDAAGIAIKAAAPAVMKSVTELGFFMPSGTDFERMKNYVGERMATVYSGWPRTEAFKRALEDLQSDWFTSAFTKGKDFNTPKAKTKEEVMALAAAFGLTFSDGELQIVMESNEQMWARTMEGKGLRRDQMGLLTTIPDWKALGEAARGAAAGIGEANEEMGEAPELHPFLNAITEAYKSIIVPVGAWTKAVEASKTAYEKSVDAMKGKSEEQKKALKEAWEPGMTSAKEYLKALEEQQKAWANYQSNVLKMIDEFGGTFDREVIGYAASKGAEFMSAFWGADRQTQAKVLAKLQKEMDQNFTKLDEDMETRYAKAAAKAQEAWANAWKGYTVGNTYGQGGSYTPVSQGGKVWGKTEGEDFAKNWYEGYSSQNLPKQVSDNLGKTDSATPARTRADIFGGTFLANTALLPKGLADILMKTDGKPAGSKVGREIHSSAQAALSAKPLKVTVEATFGWGDMDMGGMAGYGKGFGGLTPNSLLAWNKLKGSFPGAVWMGGRAARSWKSDHPFGRAFDVGGSPAQMASMAQWGAMNSSALGVKYIIYNGRIFYPGVGWQKYTPSAALLKSGADAYHTRHVHYSFQYAMGGWVGQAAGLPAPKRSTGRPVPALLHEGEFVLTENQAQALANFATGGFVGAPYPQPVVPAALIKEVNNLILALQKTFKGKELTTAILDAFRERSDMHDSYLSRENARNRMMEAYGASPERIAQNIRDNQLRLLTNAIAEAQQQVDMAVARKLPQEEVNKLLVRLYDLQGEAAQARSRLEELARVPLEQAASRWSSAVGQLSTMMDLLGNHSNALSMQMGILPQLLGGMGAQYQTNVDLMSLASTPEQVMGYATGAIGSLNSMFGAEQGVINRALQDTLSSIDADQRAWENAWRARSDAVTESVNREREALSQQLSDLQKAQRDELDALNRYYDDKLRLLDDREREISRDDQRRKAAQSIADAEEELRILKGQGFYTEADIKRMRDLEKQIQSQRDDMVNQEARWAREDERARLQREKETEVASLTQRQEMQRIALEDQIKAQQQALESRQKALQEEERIQRESFERQREAARAAAQAEIDNLVVKYQALMQTVIDKQNELLGQTMNYQNAGYQLGVSFAQGLIDALPLIQQAAQAAAQTAADYLELHSPAKLGPLSNLDEWFRPFLPTLLRPLRMEDAARPAMDTAGAMGSQVVSGEVVHRYVFEGNAQGLDLRELAREVSREMKQTVRVKGFGRG